MAYGAQTVRGSDPAGLISVAQVASRLGVHPNTVRAWAEAGRLPAYRINARGDRRFRSSDVERLLSEGAGIDAVAVSHAEPQRADARLAVITRLARGGTTTVRSTALARIAIEALRTDGGYPRAAVYRIDGPDLVLESHGGYRVAPPARRPIAATEDGLEEAWTPGSSGLARAELPLRTNRQPLGLLVVEDDAHGALSEADLPFLRTTAAALSALLFNTRVLARTRGELARARALRAVAQELSGQLDLSVVLADIVERTRSLFGADKSGLWLLEGDAHPFRVAAAYGLGEEFLSVVGALTIESDTIGVRAVREQRPLWQTGASHDRSIGQLRRVYAAEGIETVCLVPLISRGESVGLLGLYHERHRPWPEEEIALAQAFANQAAVAVNNARLYREVADQAARMRAIQDLSARLNRLTDVRAIADAIVSEASALAGYHDIRVYQVDWTTRTCEPLAFTREMLGEDKGHAATRLRVAVGEGLTGWVAEHGEPLLVENALDDPRAKTIEGTEDVEESMLVVPMLYEGRSLGVIVLSELGAGRFTADDLQTVTIFAGYAAQAIANATSYEQLATQSAELERRVDSQRRLLKINARLLSRLDHEGVFETIADGLLDVVAYDNLSIYRADDVRQVMVPVLTREKHADEVGRFEAPFGRGLMGWAVQHRQPILANDALADPRAMQIPGTPAEPEAVIVVPLVAESDVLGALNVSRVGGAESYFSETDFELVQLFATQASLALRNADAHHAVSRRAETDALTGLANHGAFQQDLKRHLAAAEGTDGSAGRVALLMMDLDRFKAFNDRHGHPAGDSLLQAVARAIDGAARHDDTVYRYGGDEFALILPGAGVADAARVAERVRRGVAELTANDATPVTITTGVAGFPADARDRDGLVTAADTALYAGKHAGEDRVVLAHRVAPELAELRERLRERGAG